MYSAPCSLKYRQDEAIRNSMVARKPPSALRIRSSGQPATFPSPPYTGIQEVTPCTTPSAPMARPTLTSRSSASVTPPRVNPCLLYTSDAADEEDSVDLG